MAKSAALRATAMEKIKRIPARQLPMVLDFLSYVEDREGWEATREILSDSRMRRDVQEGMKQAKRKRGKLWRGIRAGFGDQTDFLKYCRVK